MPPSAVFLDRDGVLCEDRVEPVSSWEEFRWLPGAIEGVCALRAAGVPVFVITNQAGVGRGLVSRAQVEEVHRRLLAHVEASGGRVRALYACFHAPEDGCACRKPRPGLLVQAAREHGVDLSQAWVVGDMGRDLEAGRAAGCRTALVRTGKGATEEATLASRGIAADLVAGDLVEAVARILAAG